MEVFGLSPNKLLIPRQERVADGVNDSRLAGVVASHQSGHALLERNLKLVITFAELPDDSDGKLL